MKTIPPANPEPEVGPKYWRGLDQLASTPEFREWMDKEFPSGASEMLDPTTRRNFVKVMSASFLLAGLGLTGCRRPEEKIYPFAKMPEGYTHGLPQYFATARPTRRSAVPLVVKSSDGRPTKIEGNPDHPDSNGGTDAMTQASLLGLYDPDRSQRCALNGNMQSRQQALDSLTSLAKKMGDGTGFAFLLEHSSSPSRQRLQKLISDKCPQAKWYSYEPVDFSVQGEAASLAYGKAVTPYYKFDEAKVIVSLDCDFIGSEENAFLNIRRFAKGRRIESKEDSMSRLYAVESLFTLTGANADHRLRIAPSMIVPVLARLAQQILGGGGYKAQFRADEMDAKLNELGAAAKAHDEWIIPCAKDLKAAGAKGLVMGGHRLPLGALLLVIAINEALGAVNHTVDYLATAESKEATISELATSLNAGQVDTLFILGGNPAYNAPTDLKWSDAQAKAKTVIRLGYHEDETAWNAASHPANQWDLPATHFLESWGDARTADGTLVPVQPLIEPLFGGINELEILAIIAGVEKNSPYEVVRETFRSLGQTGEDDWKKFLHDGFLASSASAPAAGSYNAAAAAKGVAELSAAAAPTKEKLDVVFHRDYSLDDGRHNNNGWLQEFPDPITKLTWDNAVLISPKTADELGVSRPTKLNQNQNYFDSVVNIQVGGKTVKGVIWVQPGMADNTIGLALGYGRTKTGRVGKGSGYNAYELRTVANMHYASGAMLSNTGETFALATTQSHWGMEGRPVVREANLELYREKPDFVKGMDMEKPEAGGPMYPNPLDAAKSKGLHQWGMSIDLSSCVGCSACVLACQSENNIPVVGKEMVGKSREMHWLRIDRYFTGPKEDPQAVTQPMLCQHCEAAPCESVCPVNATSHDEEGLNVMTYNRCVGTRYCSNNCPYKVRRFNFFDYNKRPLDQLYKSPLVSATDGKWELLRWWDNPDRGSRPDDDWQLIKLVKNPDVSVRMRGVMEKCTFCLQRIEQAKIGAKVKAGASDHIRLTEKEGTVPKTACQQACPAGAIVFGDVSDPESQVSKLKKQQRDYSVLEFLNTKPRLTYLAKIRNPNPEMPDYKAHQSPYSTEEYKLKNWEPAEQGGEHEKAAAKGERS